VAAAWLPQGTSKRVQQPQLATSEGMTIVVQFHQPRFRDFKTYSTEHVMKHLSGEFLRLVACDRFVEWMSRVLMPLPACSYHGTGRCTGISFVDSTPLVVCHNRRIPRPSVWAGLAARDRISMGWFSGFNFHLVANDRGELLALNLRPQQV
jgi:hypothetical protein